VGGRWAIIRGCLVTLEGGEGSGKTTQGRLLAEWLRGLGVAVTVTREPGGTEVGERLRALLLDPNLGAVRPEAEMLLFAAARAQAVTEVIAPALARGDVVICDRFVDSSLAYQGYGLGVDLGFIRSVNERIAAGIVPDLTLLFDVPRPVGAARGGPGRQPDRIEQRPETFHEAVRRGYLDLARQEPQRFCVIDAARPPHDVQEDARRAVAALLRRMGLGTGG
jgi:dTMP kinase